MPMPTWTEPANKERLDESPLIFFYKGSYGRHVELPNPRLGERLAVIRALSTYVYAPSEGLLMQIGLPSQLRYAQILHKMPEIYIILIGQDCGS